MIMLDQHTIFEIRRLWPVHLPKHPLKSPDEMAARVRATIRQIISKALQGDPQ